MKKHLTLSILIILSLAITSCRKNTTVKPEDPSPQNTSVNINGKTYPVVTVGDQLWTAANYAGDGGINLAPQNQKTEYGRYYTQGQAKAILLPAGWRLPTAADFKKLCLTQGIQLLDNTYYENGELLKKLMSTTGWTVENGTNTSTVNFLPSGFIYVDLEVGQGIVSRYWTADKVDRLQTCFSIRREGETFNAKLLSFTNDEFIPLRFVKDVQ